MLNASLIVRTAAPSTPELVSNGSCYIFFNTAGVGKWPLCSSPEFLSCFLDSFRPLITLGNSIPFSNISNILDLTEEKLFSTIRLFPKGHREFWSGDMVMCAW